MLNNTLLYPLKSNSEYIPVPCVTLPFYNDAAKIFAGSDVNYAMCGNKNLPSALSTCCGTYTDRDPVSNRDYADVLSEYRFEALTYEGNVDRCTEWGKQPAVGSNEACGRFCLIRKKTA